MEMFTVHKEAKRIESPICTKTMMELISEVFVDRVVFCNYNIIDLNTCFCGLRKQQKTCRYKALFKLGLNSSLCSVTQLFRIHMMLNKSE